MIDTITFYMLPNGLSTVLQNKRAERVSKKQTFAQLSLKAAIAVKWFKELDIADQGYIDVPELVSVFGKIESISKEQALMMAQTILRAADKEDGTADGKLTFNEVCSHSKSPAAEMLG